MKSPIAAGAVALALILGLASCAPPPPPPPPPAPMVEPAPPAPPPPMVAAPPPPPVMVRHCRVGWHWVHSHRTRRGHWVRGHCAPNRHR